MVWEEEEDVAGEEGLTKDLIPYKYSFPHRFAHSGGIMKNLVR